MNILGISEFYHDSAACLGRDGEIVAAVQEERFTRRKPDFFPQKATSHCPRKGRLHGSDRSVVAFVVNGRNPADNIDFTVKLEERILNKGLTPFTKNMIVLDTSTIMKQNHFFVLDGRSL